MKKKELKNLAKKIAECEWKLQHGIEAEEMRNEIFALSGKIHDFADLDLVDTMVQEYLSKMS